MIKVKIQITGDALKIDTEDEVDGIITVLLKSLSPEQSPKTCRNAQARLAGSIGDGDLLNAGLNLCANYVTQSLNPDALSVLEDGIAIMLGRIKNEN